MNCEIAHFIVAMIVSILVWICAVLALRAESFKSDGRRKKALPIPPNSKTPDKDLYDQCKYHGEGIYKDLDLFFKISLAIFGGIAYVALTDTTKVNQVLAKEFIGWGFGYNCSLHYLPPHLSWHTNDQSCYVGVSASLGGKFFCGEILGVISQEWELRSTYSLLLARN